MLLQYIKNTKAALGPKGRFYKAKRLKDCPQLYYYRPKIIYCYHKPAITARDIVRLSRRF